MAIEWAVRSGHISNPDSARISMPAQLKGVDPPFPTATSVLEALGPNADSVASTSSSTAAAGAPAAAATHQMMRPPLPPGGAPVASAQTTRRSPLASPAASGTGTGTGASGATREKFQAPPSANISAPLVEEEEPPEEEGVEEDPRVAALLKKYMNYEEEEEEKSAASASSAAIKSSDEASAPDEEQSGELYLLLRKVEELCAYEYNGVMCCMCRGGARGAAAATASGSTSSGHRSSERLHVAHRARGHVHLLERLVRGSVGHVPALHCAQTAPPRRHRPPRQGAHHRPDAGYTSITLELDFQVRYCTSCI